MVESNLDVPKIDVMKLHVYSRPLHPELFGIFLNQNIRMGNYDADIWVLGLGHLVCFHTGARTITELVTGESELLSDRSLAERFSLDGSRHEYQYSIAQDMFYMVSTEVEKMSEAVFEQVSREMTEFGQKRGLLMQFEQWRGENDLAPFSFIDYEQRSDELSLFCYHAFPETHLMLRTQSVFSLESLPTRREMRPRGLGGHDG